jgi:hypothetical protein
MMVYSGRALGLAVGLILAVAGSASAQQINGLAVVPRADLAPLPLTDAPILNSLPQGVVAPIPPSNPSPGQPLVADTHVDSTELGFDKGVAPAPGRIVTFRGKEYQVADVVAKGGGRTFAGGSQHVIGVDGSSLIVGLASAVPEKMIAGITVVPGTKAN